ncbi:hypothetical protein KSP40_PGU017581 [Platanthera guangdongensis]|uniref:Malectin-like domain-containing protein n=1 Tax=Platanthera guangdongensis TaxID=2320717 RepID=A0ABR2MBP0_9ASPA
MSSCPLLLFAFIFSLFSFTQSENPRIRGTFYTHSLSSIDFLYRTNFPLFNTVGLLLNCSATTPIDNLGGLLWLSDFAFISTRESRSMSFPGLLPALSTLRSFPGAGHPHRKFCYIIPNFRDSCYLVCTNYFYGGINGPGDPPVFDQIVDGTFWTIVNTTTDNVAGAASSYEGVFLARGTKMRVCLAGNDYTDSDPFMNTLEMIILEDFVYNSTDFRKKALGLIMRSIFGYDGPIVR